MAAYRLTGTGTLRTADGAAIPADPRNADWREFLAWREAGGVPDPVPVPGQVVPASVTNFQARAVMRRTFMADGRSMERTIDEQLRSGRASAAALPEADPQRIQADTSFLAWEQANEFTRDGALVNTLGAQLGMGPAALDALFIAAAGVTA